MKLPLLCPDEGTSSLREPKGTLEGSSEDMDTIRMLLAMSSVVLEEAPTHGDSETGDLPLPKVIY